MYVHNYFDYIDEDIAYLLGSIVARGEINYDNGLILIRYPYKYLEIDGQLTWQSIVISLDKVANRFKKLGFDIDKEALGPGKDITLILETKPESLQMRLMRFFFGNKTNYREFEVPMKLWQCSSNIVKEFIRGYCDVAAHIRASNRDEDGFHRVYIDVLFQNWRLPVQLCNLIQIKAGVPVHTIVWAHPNIRDPHVKHGSGNWWKKEHQIKIYAHHFLPIGFYIKHKQQLLEEYARINIERIKKGEKPRHKPCRAVIKRVRPRQSHPDEKDPDLPSEIRGQHINSYKEICIALGCKFAKTSSIERFLGHDH